MYTDIEANDLLPWQKLALVGHCIFVKKGYKLTGFSEDDPEPTVDISAVPKEILTEKDPIVFRYKEEDKVCFVSFTLFEGKCVVNAMKEEKAEEVLTCYLDLTLIGEFGNIDAWSKPLETEIEKCIISKWKPKKIEDKKQEARQVEYVSLAERRDPLRAGPPSYGGMRVIGDPTIPHGHPFGTMGGGVPGNLIGPNSNIFGGGPGGGFGLDPSVGGMPDWRGDDPHDLFPQGPPGFGRG